MNTFNTIIYIFTYVPVPFILSSSPLPPATVSGARLSPSDLPPQDQILNFILLYIIPGASVLGLQFCS